MKKSLFPLIILLLGLAACGHPPSEKAKDKRYHTTAPSLLYFKNMRSTAYEQNTQPGTRIDLYQLRKFSTTAERPILYPIIVNNWMEDEAYLFIRPNEYQRGFADPIQIRWQGGTDTLQAGTREAQYQFALRLYRYLNEGEELEVLNQDSSYIPLYENQEDRSNYMTTMRDFLRLTEAGQ